MIAQRWFRRRISIMAAILLMLGLACTKGTHEHDQDRGLRATSTLGAPTASNPSSLTTPAASVPPVPVPCSIPAPPLPVHAGDSQAFTSVLKTRRRIHVLAVEGRLLFAAASRAKTPHGPGNEYINQIHELEGNTLRPVAQLQRGIWTDFALWSAWGRWPDTVRMVGSNFGNTAWEQVGFQWDAGKGEWVEWEISSSPIQWGWGSPWEWTKDASGSRRSVSAASPVGIPKDLCDGVVSCDWSLKVVAPRDLYTTTAGCERGWQRGWGQPCVLTSILHWCAPRPRFEESTAPQAIPDANIIAVPGTALVYNGKRGQRSTFDSAWTFRDGVWTPIKPPEATSYHDWLVADGGFLWYLGAEGLHRLTERGFERVSVWRREHDDDTTVNGTGTILGRSKVTLPGADGPAVLTGFLARTPEELWLSTWNGKETQIWCTLPQRVSLGH